MRRVGAAHGTAPSFHNAAVLRDLFATEAFAGTFSLHRASLIMLFYSG